MVAPKKSIYNGSDKSTSKNKPVMSRTSGVARRKADTAGKLLNTNEIKTALNKGAPLTGSASGVKSISLKQAGEVLTQGIVTVGKKGLQMDPAGLAMALPVGKLRAAAVAAIKVGKMSTAGQLLARVARKQAGKAIAQEQALIRKFGNELSIGAPNTPVERIGSKLYPKSYGQSGAQAPVSDIFTTRSPSAGTYWRDGIRYVDNRYRYNMPKVKPNKNNY